MSMQKISLMRLRFVYEWIEFALGGKKNCWRFKPYIACHSFESVWVFLMCRRESRRTWEVFSRPLSLCSLTLSGNLLLSFTRFISSPFGVFFFSLLKKPSNIVNYGTIVVGFFKIQYYDFICILYLPEARNITGVIHMRKSCSPNRGLQLYSHFSATPFLPPRW